MLLAQASAPAAVYTAAITTPSATVKEQQDFPMQVC
jgi:hypothetical protein